MKHPDICSYTIPNIPLEDKWGVLVKTWANKILSKIKGVLRFIVKNKWRDMV
jgi:hypothetical protein